MTRFPILALALAVAACGPPRRIAAAHAQVGVSYAAAAYTRCTALKTAGKVKKGQQIVCPADAPAAALVAAAPPPVVAPLLVSVTPPVVAPAASKAAIGMNLAGVSYYSSEYPFLDRMRMTAGWSTEKGPLTDAQLDHGWPNVLPDGASGFYIPVGFDPPGTSPSNRYVITWQGTSTLYIDGARPIETAPNRMVVEATKPVGSFHFTQTGTDPATFPRAVTVVREDRAALLTSGEIFEPAFLELVRPFKTLRMMDWEATNGSPLVRFADRATPASQSWQSYGMSTVPLEVQIALANRLGRDLWICIPFSADDDYVRQALTLVRDTLLPALRVHVEYSNENWNWASPQSHQALDLATKMGKNAKGEDANWMTYAGWRAAQVAAIGVDVFQAAPKRLRNVLATQTGWTGLEYALFDGIARAGGDPRKLFQEYAVATYFGDHMSGATPEDIVKLKGWAAGGAAGLDAAFAELEHGGALAWNASLDALKGQIAYQGGIAKQYGLALVAYEGGLHETAYRFDPADQPAAVDFIQRQKADPRMAKAYQRMADDFVAAGGTDLLLFNDVGPTSVWGGWGMVDSIYQTNPLAEAIKAWAR